MNLRIFLLLSLILITVLCQVHFGTIYYDTQESKYSYAEKLDIKGLATGFYEDTIEVDGWYKISLRSNGEHYEGIDDGNRAYAMGLLEGIVSRERILQSYSNWITMQFPKGIPTEIVTYFKNNLNYINQQISSNQDSDYWKSISLWYKQIQGVADGINREKQSGIDYNALIIYNSQGDVGDLQEIFVKDKHNKPANDHSQFDHCSGFVKFVDPGKNSKDRFADDDPDIFSGQATWNTWYSLVRELKHYQHNFRTVHSGSSLFSGYPGIVASLDSFYQLDRERVVLETTFDNFNLSSKENAMRGFPNYETVFTWARALTCNLIAKNGQDWTDCFKQHNSGTYNCDWLVVDYKKFFEGSKTDLVWCAEQCTEFVLTMDLTEELLENGYVASYNIPRFPEVFNSLGYNTAVKKWGNWFTFDGHPRSKIFARNQSDVYNVQTMKNLMRYNDWQNDPLSDGNAANAISSRKDLITNAIPIELGGNPWAQKSCFGGLDAKVTSQSNLLMEHIWAQLGPTHDQQPVFSWSTAPDVCDNIPHEGQPDVFNFDWILWNLSF
ncbi:phospholipase b-related [Anaeramoeba flamelloides]|uniref:Phospholipase B-like n=1 Tax=Anaeramoeba flamelloides TaxID=1746091 RepID=A0AAV8A9V1_9EUKA|nr:phospholipase b-related [Anaeramoeba flamelloides]KAJ6253621.1 phospholipase b-related [Anaeramoeba flamelloides]